MTTESVTKQKSLIERVQTLCGKHLLGSHHYRGQETILVQREGLLETARVLKEDPELSFDFLMDLSCVDYLKFGRSLGSAPMISTPSPLPYYMKSRKDDEQWERIVSSDRYRYEAVYHFYSSVHTHRLRVKVPLTAADPKVESLTSLWLTADWFEREVWDMYGVVFNGHPNLKRILMYEEFQGHPLRKDYPIRKRQPLIGPKDTV